MLTGIGHERDNTVLDEVAHLRFDTPSKVIAGVEQHIGKRAREAQASFDLITSRAASGIARMRTRADRVDQEVRTSAATTLLRARARASESIGAIQHAARSALHLADRQTREHMADVRHGASQAWSLAQREAPAALDRVLAHAQTHLKVARRGCDAALPTVLTRAAANLRQSKASIQDRMDSVAKDARGALTTASGAAQSLVREIAGQGPRKTLGRGFAIVRGADGRTLTTARGAAGPGSPIDITFADGVAQATVRSVRLAADGSTQDEIA